MKKRFSVLAAAAFAGLLVEASQAQQQGADNAKRLEALMNFIQQTTEGQTTRLWGRNKVEKFEVRKYNAWGKGTVEAVIYQVKIGDTTYQVTPSEKKGVQFSVRKKKTPEALFVDADRDGRVDSGEFFKAKTPEESKRFSAQEGAEYREFWQQEYEKALDALCQYLDVPIKEKEPTTQ